MARWKKIPGYEDQYEVSSEGQVRSFDREVNASVGYRAVRKGRILTPVVKASGYLYVTLTKDEKREQIAIHRLVLLAFRGVVTSYTLHARHRDGVRSNNRLRNIIPGTPKENSADQRRHGRSLQGSRHPMAKLTEAQARRIKFAPTPAAGRQIGEKLGVCAEHTYSIRAGRCWKHLKE